MNTKILRYLMLSIVLVLLLTACAPNPAAIPTLVPTLSLGTPDPSQPQTEVQATEGAVPPPGTGAEGTYPGPEGAATVPAADPALAPTQDSAYPGPASVPVVDNRSRVTARLVEQAPDDANPGWVRLRAEILTSDTVDQMPTFTGDKIGQEIDLYVEAAGLPDLAVGDSFSALVTYHADESGGRFTAAEVQKEG